MAGNSTEPGRSVASKVAAILLTFQADDKHSLTEIARLTRLPVSTAHRLVAELEGWGLLERTDDAQFRAASALKTFDCEARHWRGISDPAQHVLEDLAAATRMDARLGILVGVRVAFMEKRYDCGTLITFGQAPALPAHASALGKVLLAFCPAEARERILTDGLRRYTPHTVTDSEKLRRCLATIRQTGVAVSQWEFELGTSSVAVPVLGAGHTAVAALSLIVANLRTDLCAASYALAVAARRLSRELTIVPQTGHVPLTTAGHDPGSDYVPQQIRRAVFAPREVLQVS